MYEIDAYSEIPTPYAVFELLFNGAGNKVIDTRSADRYMYRDKAAYYVKHDRRHKEYRESGE